MRRLILMGALLLLAWAALALAGPGPASEGRPMTSLRMTLEQRVGSEVYQQAGLNKLTPEEQWVLADWLRGYTQEITTYVEEQCRRQASPGPAGGQPPAPPRP